MNTNMSGASMTNITYILAHNISLIEKDEIHNIKDLCISSDRIKSSHEVVDEIAQTPRYEYDTNDISDNNVSGIQSMIDDINTHYITTDTNYITINDISNVYTTVNDFK